MYSNSPVIHDESLEARKTAAGPMSCGADASKRCRRLHLRAEVACMKPRSFHAFSQHHTGVDRIDSNLSRPEFFRQCPCDCINRALGRSVYARRRGSGDACHRADVDHASTIDTKVPRRLLSGGQQTEDIQIELLSVRFIGHRLERRKLVDSGIIDQHIQTRESAFRLGKHPLHIAGLRHVRLHGNCLSAICQDSGDNIVRSPRARRKVHHDCCPFGREVRGDRRANAL